jgi:hypothetical protein
MGWRQGKEGNWSAYGGMWAEMQRRDKIKATEE